MTQALAWAHLGLVGRELETVIVCGGLRKRGNEPIDDNLDVCVAARLRLARDIKHVDVSFAKPPNTLFERQGGLPSLIPQNDSLFDSRK